MKRNIKKLYKKLIIGIACIILLMTTLVLMWRSFTYSEEEMLHCTAIVECHSYYSISMNGHPTLFFSNLTSDSTFANITTNIDSARQNKHYSAAFWADKLPVFPSCFGKLVTASLASSNYSKINTAIIPQLLNKEKKRLKSMADSMKSEAGELKYYLSVHGVQDEGYGMIAKYASKLNTELKEIDSIITIIKTVDAKSKFSVNHYNEYFAIFYDKNSKRQYVKCNLKATSWNGQYRLLQIADKKTPEGVSAISMKPWRCLIPKNITIISYAGLSNKEFASISAKPQLIVAKHSLKQGHNMPSLLVADGSPVFSRRGRFLGITIGKKVLSRRSIVKLFDKEK